MDTCIQSMNKHFAQWRRQAMTSQITDATMEKRKNYRKTCNYLPVDFVLDDRLQRGLIMNISEAGASVENSADIQPGTQATMTFLESHEQGPVKTTAKVVRSFESGFAVRFDALTPRQLDAINSFINMA